MTHSALLYRVRIHKVGSPKSPLQLGNFDGAGTWLGTTIAKVLPTAKPKPNTSRKHTSSFESAAKTNKSQHVGATFVGRKTGVRTVETLAANNHQPQPKIETDSSDYRLACLFSLPHARTEGRAAFLVVDGHSCHSEVLEVLKNLVPGHLVELKPLIDRNAFTKAVKHDQVKEVVFTKRRKGSQEFSTLGQDGYGTVHVSTRVRPVGHDVRLVWSDLKAKIGSKDGMPKVEYDGVEYDEARVTVHQNGIVRTYALTDTERGRALSEIIPEWDDTSMDDLGYTAAEMIKRLADIVAKLPG